MVRCGITEAGDAGLDLSWVAKLQPTVNVIITKHLNVKNRKLISALKKNADRIILHVTCTGYGGTKIEPNVPDPSEVVIAVKYLIDHGFPADHIVLRTDPIIPTEKGIQRVKDVWKLFEMVPEVRRCRYSIIDMYPHVRERFREAFGTVPFESFQAPKEMMDAVKTAVESLGHYEFESCAEGLPEQCGCISKKDFDILGVEYNQDAGGFQRKGCLCCAGKTELLTHKTQCPSGCLYCYWKK